MSKFSILVGKIYKQKITSKSFIILTLLYLAIVAVVINWSSIKNLVSSSDDKVVIALKNSTDVSMNEIFASDKTIQFKKVDSDKKDINDKVIKGDYDGALYVSASGKQLKAEIATNKSLELNVQTEIENLVSTAGQIYKIQKLNLSSEQAKEILDTSSKVVQTDLSVKNTSKSAEQKRSGVFIAYIFGFFIYIFTTNYMSMVTTDIASEKGSRVLEVLMASIKPVTHMLSKIIGVFLTGMTQFAIVIIGSLILIKLSVNSESLNRVTSIFSEIKLGQLLLILSFFILTIILFLIVGSLAGSLVSKVEESSQVMMPSMLISLAGFYVLASGVFDPDTMLVKVCSYIPFTSGMVMVLRIGATDISIVSVLISLGILLATVIAFLAISLSFYKRSVLTYSTGGIIKKIKTVLKVTT